MTRLLTKIDVTTNITDILPEVLIKKIHTFVSKKTSLEEKSLREMINDIENYINVESSKWIYGSILRNAPETRYPILVIHYLDRNPGKKNLINSQLPKVTIRSIDQIKQSFKLGC